MASEVTSSNPILASLEAAASHAADERSCNSSQHLFSGVTISARGGHCLVLLGPNGCGKTSVARALLGLAPLSSGQRTTEPGVRLAYMPQDYRNACFPWLSIRDNIALRLCSSVQAGHQDPDVDATMNDEMAALCHRLDIQVDLKKYPDKLSGGELQILLFLATMVMPATLRVFDEPFSALDFRRRVVATDLMSDTLASRQSEAWIVITHDIIEGVQLADEVAVFNTSRTITERIKVKLPRPRGFSVRDDPAALSAIAAVRKAVGIA